MKRVVVTPELLTNSDCNGPDNSMLPQTALAETEGSTFCACHSSRQRRQYLCGNVYWVYFWPTGCLGSSAPHDEMDKCNVVGHHFCRRCPHPITLSIWRSSLCKGSFPNDDEVHVVPFVSLRFLSEFDREESSASCNDFAKVSHHRPHPVCDNDNNNTH